MARWNVTLYGIEWDDGKGQYDVSDLPQSLKIEVEADNSREAMELALQEASDEFGSLVNGCEQLQAKRA